jgi:hypothetical protein
MTKPIARDPIYRGRRFEAEIIELCVRWYITYRLSYRDVVAMMAERGLAVSHTTILRWVIRYVPEFEKRGADVPERSTHPGGLTRLTSRCGERGTTFTAQSTSGARPSIFCSDPTAVLRRHRHSSARHWTHPCRGGRARSRLTGTPRAIRRFGSCAGRIRGGSMCSSEAAPI